MAEEKFRLPISSYEELVKIIEAYGEQKTAVAPKQVATTAKVHETIVSGNNAFFSSVGIVDGTRQKSVTDMGKKLSLALTHEIKDEVSSAWRQIVEANDFLMSLISSVRIRRGMDPATFVTHIAYSVSAPKTAKTKTGAGAILEILKTAELVREEGGVLLAQVPKVDSQETTTPISHSSISDLVAHNADVEKARNVATEINVSPGLVRVNINCTPADIDVLLEKLPKLLALLRSEEQTPIEY